MLTAQILACEEHHFEDQYHCLLGPAGLILHVSSTGFEGRQILLAVRSLPIPGSLSTGQKALRSKTV